MKNSYGMRRFFKALLVFLLICSVCFSFSACNRSYNEAEVKEAALSLIEKSVLLNKIYWGEGIPYIEGGSNSNGSYHEAHFFALAEMGFSTVDELKSKTEEVFSKSYSESIFKTAFSSVVDGEELQFFARYYQKYEDEEQKVPICIMVYSGAENLLPDAVEYHYGTLKVTHSKDDRVFVSLEATVTNSEGKTQRKTKTIALIEEESGWRIDSSTYLKYNENESQYEDLENK